MQAHLRLARIQGIDIGLHYSWIFIGILITVSLAAHFSTTHPEWQAAGAWGAAIITGILFFATLIAHELSHSMVARARGLPVRSITLFALGGVAQIEKEAADARTEFWMAIAGPLMSVTIGAVLLGIAAATGWTPGAETATPFEAIIVWLGYINIALAVFNMIPGFPLDGGRVLRSIIWGVTGDAEGSTRIAARVGQVVAGAFILYGLFSFVTGAGFGGLWIALIGWFLLEAASASYAHVEVTRGLRGVRAADLMSTDCIRVDAGENLRDFVEERLLRSGRRCFLVERDGRLAGLVTIAELKQVNRSDWDRLRVEDAMRPLAELRTIGPDTPASETLEIMSRNDVNQLPVVSNGRIDGIVSRGNILHYLRNRAELEV